MPLHRKPTPGTPTLRRRKLRPLFRRTPAPPPHAPEHRMERPFISPCNRHHPDAPANGRPGPDETHPCGTQRIPESPRNQNRTIRSIPHPLHLIPEWPKSMENREQPPALGDDSYRMSITPQGIDIQAVNTRGFYYGLQTLKQLILRRGGKRPSPIARSKTGAPSPSAEP